MKGIVLLFFIALKKKKKGLGKLGQKRMIHAVYHLTHKYYRKKKNNFKWNRLSTSSSYE